MHSGFLIYKCKRCRELIKNSHAPDGNITLCSIITNTNIPKEWGVTPTKEDIHTCKDGNLGMTELIGFEYDKM
jgi:hypothetical protein